MAYPTVGPQLAGIVSPEIWSAKTIDKFYKKTRYSEIANTDYEGEITKVGCKVWMRTIADTKVHRHSKYADMTLDNIEPGRISLEIDHGIYTYFGMDAVDQWQSDLNFMELQTADGARQTDIVIDGDILGDIYAGAASFNKGANAGQDSQDINAGSAGSPLVLSSTTVIEDLILMVGNIFDEADVPEEDRHLILPPWMIRRIKASDIKVASLMGEKPSTLRTGKIGMIDNLTIWGSRNLAMVVDNGVKCWHAVAVQKRGLTFASNVVESVYFDKFEKRSGKGARQLQAYGWAVTIPACVIDLYISR